MLADNKQIDIRTTMRNQNRSAALGITGEGGGGGAGGFNVHFVPV